ncbi:MAG: phosphopentomutase [Gemmatimonadales bacterium]|nr:MAG: phosphopentomutase [Gemmatimonadales bacterium]
MSRRAVIVVLDGLGIGPAHDTATYGDTGSDTLGNTLRSIGGLSLPNLEALGLGCCAPLTGVAAVATPSAAWGTCQPAGAGKDSTTGHWEVCGLTLAHPFPTYPDGFPDQVLAEFSRRTGRAVLGNVAASGTAILDQLGAEHQRTGAWIVYTSADSVFQVAAHEHVVPLEELYAACAEARDLLQPPHGVARVIARPFVGDQGAWTRTSHRRDLSVPPPGPTLLDRLAERHVPRLGVGKVDDLFAGRNIASVHAASNAEGYHLIGSAMESVERGLIFANILEFDQTWGHRNDVPGFAAGLEELDRVLPGLLARVRKDDLVIFSADHGNDPTTPSTDHSRERVPLLVYGPGVRAVPLGERSTFADIGQTVAEFLGAAPLGSGRSFLGDVWNG